MKKQRVAIEFSTEAFERLNQIREVAGASSNAEVIRDALRVYDFLLNNRKNGWAIHLVKDKYVKELELLLPLT